MSPPKPKTTGYAAVAKHYRKMIESGELGPGDPMPTLDAVADERGVARNTAVRAYEVLKREGLITSRPGSGTVVTTAGIHLSGVDRIERIERGESPLLPGETAVENMAGLRSVDDMAVAEALGVDLRDEIAVRTRVFVRDGKRRMYGISCYHPRAFAAVPEIAIPTPLPAQWQRLYQERTGREVHRSPKRYGARIATPDELRRLHVFADPTASRAVLIAVTVFHDEDGPLAYWEDVYAPGEHVAVPDPR